MTTLPYSTALALKKAGFPQSGKITFKAIPADQHLMQAMLDDGDYCSIPTLEELIEACGNVFGGLELLSNGEVRKWGAYEITESQQFSQIADSPLEAVANLYLALHPIKE